MPIFKHAELPWYWLIAIFFIKILAAWLYGIFYSQDAYLANSDTWRYYTLSLKETDWLLHDPVAFFVDLFQSGYDRPSHLFSSHASYWNDLKDNVIVKSIAVCNVLTFRNYYANAVIFNLVYFIGPVLLFGIAVRFCNLRRWVLVILVFFLPSFLFWQSGLHKDGLIFTCIMVIVNRFYQLVERGKTINWMQICSLIIACILLFSFRNYMLLMMIPAMAAWWIIKKMHSSGWWLSISIYGVMALIFFTSRYFVSSLNFMQYVVERHNEFASLGGGSQIQLPQLEASWQSFLFYLPHALNMAFIRPYLSESGSITHLAAFAEQILMVCFALYLFTPHSIQIRHNRPSHSCTGLAGFLFFYSISILLLAGYTVTLSGAIVRYRSMILPFLMLLVAQLKPMKKTLLY
jgi:hypothetical protein